MDLDRALDENGPHLIADRGVGDGVARRLLGGTAAQLGLVLLAHGGQRDLVDDLDVLRRGGALRHVLARPRLELVDGQVARAFQRDERDRHLARVRVGPPNGSGCRHLWMIEQRVLDRGRIDVVAAADDQVLGATR